METATLGARRQPPLHIGMQSDRPMNWDAIAAIFELTDPSSLGEEELLRFNFIPRQSTILGASSDDR